MTGIIEKLVGFGDVQIIGLDITIVERATWMDTGLLPLILEEKLVGMTNATMA